MTGLQNPSVRTSLMSVLWDIQKKRRFISRDDMTKIASEFHMSRMELEGVISFYHFYHRTHAGKFTIYLNNAVIAKNKNYHKIRRTFEDVLGIKVGEVTKDQQFGLFETSCIGLSDQEVSVLINFHAFTELSCKKVKRILGELRNGIQVESICDKPKANINGASYWTATSFWEYRPKRLRYKLATEGMEAKELKGKRLRDQDDDDDVFVAN